MKTYWKHLVASMIVAISLGCIEGFPGYEPINPYTDLAPIALDGQPKDVAYTIVPLGTFNEGDVIRLNVTGAKVKAVLILTRDTETDDSGLLAGGGRPNETFDYRVQIAGAYYVFVYFDPTAGAIQRRATIAAERGPSDYTPPSVQYVQVLFAPDYLYNPGLYDPTSGTPDQQQFLQSISDQVKTGIVNQLREIFDGTPIVILSETDPLPSAPVSKLTYLPDHVPASDQDIIDVAMPPPDPNRPQCNERVVFGERLPRGEMQDTGNRVPDDEAVVYTGSFQGRGAECQTAAINSANNIILTLSQTGAHEIGHLGGLYHVEQIDIMNRSATLAFQRALFFMRSQIQIEKLQSGEITNEVLTSVIQDPLFYFQASFQ